VRGENHRQLPDAVEKKIEEKKTSQMSLPLTGFRTFIYGPQMPHFPNDTIAMTVIYDNGTQHTMLLDRI